MVKRYLFFISLLVFMLFPLHVYADDVSMPDGTVINNNTKVESIPPSFPGIDYYDVLIPYAKSNKDIGGYSIGGPSSDSDTKWKASQNAIDYNCGDYINKQVEPHNSSSSLSYNGILRNGCSMRTENDSTVVYDQTGYTGNKFYMISLGEYFYKNRPEGFYGFDKGNRGQIVDIYLTSGVCIHAVIGDAKSSYHTNGGVNGSGDGATDNYYFQTLYSPEGANMYQAYAGEIVELFCKTPTTFSSIYDLQPDGSGEHIAFIRMYKAKIGCDKTQHTSSPVERASGVGPELCYNVGSPIFYSADGYNTGDNSLGVTGSNMVEEWELVGMPVRVDLTALQSDIHLLDRNSLGVLQSNLVAQLQSDISLRHEADLMDAIRVFVIFIGLVILLYAVLLSVGILFDRANNFIDMSLVYVLTFGRLHYDPWGETVGSKQSKGFVSTKTLVISIVVLFLVGMVLVSGGVFRFAGEMIYRITSYFN